MLAEAVSYSSAPDPTPTTAWAYRRQARRLRHQHRGDAVTLVRSLSQLARKTDAARISLGRAESAAGLSSGITRNVQTLKVETRPWTQKAERNFRSSALQSTAVVTPFEVSENVCAAVKSSPACVNEFATLVSAELSQGILRQSQRSALCKQAKKLGIDGFEANLLIAIVEHRRPQKPSNSGKPVGSVWGGWVAGLLAAAILGLEAVLVLKAMS